MILIWEIENFVVCSLYQLVGHMELRRKISNLKTIYSVSLIVFSVSIGQIKWLIKVCVLLCDNSGIGFGKRGCHVGEAQEDVGETTRNGTQWRNQEAEASLF